MTVLAPIPAFAHASDRGFVLLLPTQYYLTGGAAAVAASFIVLLFVQSGILERAALWQLRMFTVPERGRLLTSLAGFLIMIILLAAGFTGSRDPLSNPLPLTVWTLIWIGLTLVQGLVGNLWRWINPWHAPVTLVINVLGKNRLTSMPASLGWWPAIILFFGFAWLELIDPAPDDPFRLAYAASIYFAFNAVMAVIYGPDDWLERGECISAFFTMIGRLGVLGREGGAAMVSLRLPGAALFDTSRLPLSGVLLILLTLASVSFDGFSRTFFWLALNGINPLEFPGRTAMITINTTGLVASFLLLVGVFVLAVGSGSLLVRRTFAGTLGDAGLLVWSIVPIALAYHFAHYLTALVVNGQYALVALSDPFSIGWNLFGTSDNQVSAGIVMGSDSVWVLWNLQAGAIIAGHVMAVLVAHLLAARIHSKISDASLSQLPLTVLMVGYTLFGLWLLSTPTGA